MQQYQFNRIQPAVFSFLRRSVSPGGLLAFLIAASPALSQVENNVNWQGVSHTGWNDRSPRVPRANQSFKVRFQTFRNDVVSARVRVDSGSVSFTDAVKTGSRGPYDLWEATVPATATTTLTYTIELTDGSDTDYLGSSGMVDTQPIAAPFTLNFTTLEHAPVGATPVPGGTVFKVWSPSRSSVHVRGQFNNWGTTNPLTKVGEHFIGFVPGAVAGQRYKYYFNDSVWNTDPRASALVPTDSNNAVIIDHEAYQWQNPGFSPAPIEEMVIYQLHVGTFAGRNDPQGTTPNPSRYIDVTNRADHLAELGVNAVMLNPIHEFPGNFSGGYNSINPWSIESSLGTPDQFKAMVDALHARGIAVLLDVVWNHVSSSDNYLWNFDGTQLYYDATAVETPWGPQADFDKQGVFDYYLESAEHMLSEYRLDGFRVDATMYLTDSGLTPQWGRGQAFIRGVNDLKERRHVDKHTIAEIYIDNRWVTDPISNGLGFTAQYQNEFKEAVRSAVFGAGSGSPNMQRIANVLDGQGFGVSGSSVFNYFELHDDCWPLNGHQRAIRQIDPTAPHDDLVARGRVKIGQSLTLLSRGVPGIVQGTEWLEDDGWETTKIDWSHKSAYDGAFAFYRDLISLRTSEPALFANSALSTYHVNEAMDVMAFERSVSNGGSYVAVVNLSNSDRNGYRIGMPRDGRWTVVINSNDPIYDGPGGGPSGELSLEPVASGPFPRSVVLDLPARSIVLVRHDPIVDPPCPADVNGDALVDLLDLLDFVSVWSASLGQSVTPDAPGDFDGNGVVDLIDLLGFVSEWSANLGQACP